MNFVLLQIWFRNLQGIIMPVPKGILLTPKHPLIIPFISIFFCFITQHCIAQDANDGSRSKDKAAAIQAFQMLKQGSLIVILPYYQSQLDFFDTELNKNYKTSYLKKLERSKTDLIKKRDKENSDLRTAFDEGFKTAPILYIYDKDYLIANDVHNNQFLLGTDWRPDPSLRIGSKTYLIASIIEKNYEGNYKSNLNVMFPDFRRIPAPFPDRIRTHFIFFKNSMSRNVKTLQAKLDSFAEKYN